MRLSGIICYSLVLGFLCLSAPVGAETSTLERLQQIRKQQEFQEKPLRVQAHVAVANQQICSPVEQVRERMEHLERWEGRLNEQYVSIEAGHKEVNVTDNHGTISSDVTIQIVKNEEGRKCL